MQEPETNSLTSTEEWISIGEAAEILGVSKDTLRRWEKAGKIKTYRSPTNRRLYKKSELKSMYQKNDPIPLDTITSPSPSPQLSPENTSEQAQTASQIEKFEKTTPEMPPQVGNTSDLPPLAAPSSIENPVVENERPSLAEPVTSTIEPKLPAFVPPVTERHPIDSSFRDMQQQPSNTPAPQPLHSPVMVTPVTFSPDLSPSPTATPAVTFREDPPAVAVAPEKDKRPSTQVQVLKIISIALSIVLILLGIGVTVLVFI